MTKPKAATPKPSRPNAHLEERSAAVRRGKGKLLKPKGEAAPEAAEAASPSPVPQVRVPMPLTAHPETYGLRVDDSGLGWHAPPGATVMVEPVAPTKAGLAVFYMEGRPNPLIFDLTRNFRPEFAGPFGPGSEVIPLIEVVTPGLGQWGRMRADQVKKMHRVLGIYTPAEVMERYGPGLTPLPELSECPEGMGEQYVEGSAAYPLVRSDETVVYDPSQREPTDGALCVIQWSGGQRDVLQTNRRPINRDGEERWFVDPVNRPRNTEMMKKQLDRNEPGITLYASDGPYTVDHLREKIVGTVVGILAPQRQPRGNDDEEPTDALAPIAPAPDVLAPGSEEAKAAWRAACREHSVRTASLNDNPELARSQHEIWTTQSLMRALETGEIAVADYTRLHSLASKRELRFAEITHELNIGGLFALAYADEYPVASGEDAPAPIQPDPVFAAIGRYLAARTLSHSLDEVRDGERFLEADAQRIEALNALEDTRPTTVAGLLAMARTLDAYLREDIYAGDYDESFEGAALSALVDACRGLADPQRSAPEDVQGPDPIFAAIEAHVAAREAFSATVNPQDKPWRRQHGLDVSDEAIVSAHAAYDAASEAEAKAWVDVTRVRPTTLPGVLALLRHAEQHAAEHDGMDGTPSVEDVFGIVADGLATLTDNDERNEPLTVESAATVDFKAIDPSDIPLRSPQEWAEKLCNQALGMHVADKTLRMSKPELVAFLREASGGGEGVDATLYKAIDYARENLAGWAKLLDVARTRFLVAGSTHQLELDAQKKVGA